MATKKQTAQQPADVKLAQENAELRKKLEEQATTQRATLARLQALLPTASASASELMVGVRNISDNSLGINSPFAGEPPLHLHGDVGATSDPGRYAAITFAFWMQLRKSEFMRRGMIMRDDSILAGTFQAAPPDRPEDISPEWVNNAIVDPVQWIAEKNEAQVRAALTKITSEDSLRRIRRVVDDMLRVLQEQYKDDQNPAKRAVKELPAIYQMLDQVITERLEKTDEVL